MLAPRSEQGGEVAKVSSDLDGLPAGVVSRLGVHVGLDRGGERRQ